MRGKLRWFIYSVLTALVAVVGFYYISRSRTYQVCGRIVDRGPANARVVALTFDDGPSLFTDSVLAVLDREHVKATFFIEGAALINNMATGRYIVASGHDLGNHSFSHNRMIMTTYGTVSREIETTDSLIRACGFGRDIYFRPPYCKKFLVLPLYLFRNGRTTVTWDVEAEAGNDDALSIVKETIDHVQPGSIVLLHCMQANRQQARKALPMIIHELRRKGYDFRTLSELL